MASLKTISLPHGTIPTQMFGNVNLQNAVMYINENFAEMKNGVNDAISATNDALKEKAESDHDHDTDYAELEHTHGMDAIIGLAAALDGKAELNHEHSQYLSSLPAHYHDVSGIQGLGEQLQSKAEKTHGHTMAQVEGLDTKLGVLASTSYVDQQVNSVGSSIKTIADQEVESYGANKGNSESGHEESGDVPKDVELEKIPSGETPEQKIVRRNAQIGSSVLYARADHRHTMKSEKTTPTATKGISVHGEYPALADFYDYPDKAAHPSDPAIVFPEFQARLDLIGEHIPPDRMTGADNSTPVGWERGKTAWRNGHDVDAEHPAVGCSMTVCTHMRQVSISGEGKYQALFSRMEFDENGLLVRVVPCSNWFTLM